MASETPNLGLIKPARGEFTGTWDVPMNANSDAIDTAVGAVTNEVDTARGTAGSLNARLSTGLDPAGNVLPSPEIVSSRNSAIYGNFSLLSPRLKAIDSEVLTSRQSLPSIRDLVAFSLNSHKDNAVVTAPTGYLTFTGANVYANGSVTPVVADINGYRQAITTQISTTVSGAAGTYYIYMQRNPSGQTVLTGTGTGTVTVDLSTNLTVLNDTTMNFATLNVQPGFLLNITSSGSQNLGTYVISTVGYNANPNNLQIIGSFVTSQSGLNYTIVNPVAPTLGFTATPPAKRYASVSNRIYIGEAVFDGTNVTGLVQYALQGHYEGFTSVSLISGNFNLTIPHNLGYVPTRALLYGSQASDFSQVLEPLATDATSGALAVVVTSGTTTASLASVTTSGTTSTSVNPTVITGITTTGIYAGMIITGTGIATDSVVLATTATTVIMSLAATATGTNSLTFTASNSLNTNPQANTITGITTTGINFGMTVSGTGIPASTIVLGVTASTVILNQPATSSGTVSLTFSPNPATTNAPQRSVVVSMDHLNIYVKNATNGVFYQSFSGSSQTSGFLFAVVDR